ncbi:DUF4236 domain-containing protein [Halomonas maura]|uniref:DUF4236 domain-containing protein n=1 Tax=Halomonas maura TaxID=117606 RepID=UPI0025B537EA|nr:DUF4236 domain-containing protein [Halomonas maura]MDN3555052.1 DUF4236 domain-containing protein [Halomonas maura]
MALRFRKRIKVAPGLRLNLGKSGIGASVGPRGARVTISKRGVHAKVGIPGTGLSYRSRLDGPSGPRHTDSRRSSGSESSPAKRLEEALKDGGEIPVVVEVDDSGQIDIRDGAGERFDDAEFRVLKRYMGDSLRELVQAECERLNAELDRLGRIHLETPPPLDQPRFQRRTFRTPEPQPEPPLRKSAFARLLWPPAGRAIDAENQARDTRYREAMDNWRGDRHVFEQHELRRQKRDTDWVRHDIDAMAEVLEDYLGEIPWPRETAISFDLGSNAATVAIDIELPQEDAFPGSEWSMPAGQLKVSRKALPATRRRQLYRDHAHGVAMRVLGEVFHRLPSVKVAMLSAYTDALDQVTGNHEETYLYSVLVPKPAWKMIDFAALDRLDPVQVLEAFALRRKLTRTGIFKPITPFTPAELEQAASLGAAQPGSHRQDT